jgi:hypothetical protein
MKVYICVFILVILFALLSLSEIPSLLKNKQHKELIIVIALLSMGFILNILMIFGIKIPNFIKILTSIFSSFL